MKKKFLWQFSETEKAIITIETFSEKVSPKKYLTVIPYAPDNRILECALAGEADFIISGDHHLSDLKDYQGITIVNPATFLAIFQSLSKFFLYISVIFLSTILWSMGSFSVDQKFVNNIFPHMS